MALELPENIVVSKLLMGLAQGVFLIGALAAAGAPMGRRSIHATGMNGVGVPALAAGGVRPIMLALKSGNFGAPDFYAKALGILEGA